VRRKFLKRLGLGAALAPIVSTASGDGIRTHKTRGLCDDGLYRDGVDHIVWREAGSERTCDGSRSAQRTLYHLGGGKLLEAWGCPSCFVKLQELARSS
jgi:hypothetical protein